MSRGRKKIDVNSTQLQDQIRELERAQPDGKFPNRSALWSALEATEWAKSRNPRPLTGQVARVLAQHSGLTIATPVGQRGRQAGAPPIQGERKRRVISLDIVTDIKKRVPKEFHKVVDKAVGGSLKAVIKGVCLDCTNYQPAEVRNCELRGCIVWPFRPFKGKKNAEPAGTGV
jgi:hypothetical protein